MEITKEFLESRLAEYRQEREKALMMVNKLDGAMVATQLLIEVLDKPLFEEDEIEFVEENEDA